MIAVSAEINKNAEVAQPGKARAWSIFQLIRRMVCPASSWCSSPREFESPPRRSLIFSKFRSNAEGEFKRGTDYRQFFVTSNGGEARIVKRLRDSDSHALTLSILMITYQVPTFLLSYLIPRSLDEVFFIKYSTNKLFYIDTLIQFAHVCCKHQL